MSDEEFSKHKASLAVKILEKPKNMPRCFAEFWGEIHAKEYNFDRATVAVAYLKTLAKDQILQYYKVNFGVLCPIRYRKIPKNLSKIRFF